METALYLLVCACMLISPRLYANKGKGRGAMLCVLGAATAATYFWGT